MKINFESDYQAKLMEITPEEVIVFRNRDDVSRFREKWLEALTSWHSPYKALIDCQNLRFEPEDSKELKKAISQLLSLLKSFHLKNAVGFSPDFGSIQEYLGFEIVSSREEAAKRLNIRERKERIAGDFRSSIVLDNHFQQHTIEVSFLEKANIDSSEKIETFKQKLMNNLMQWHSAWNLLIDCKNLTIACEMNEQFKSMLAFFERFFLKNTIGYNHLNKNDQFPFNSFRSRHKAAAMLENEGNFSGKEADCRSRKGQN